MMTNELLIENSILTQQRDKMVNEYLGVIKECDQCIAQTFCILNGLRKARVPKEYCNDNVREYLKSLLYPLKES